MKNNKKKKKKYVKFNPLQQALMSECKFGKYKGKTYGWIVKNDIFYLHWYSRVNAGAGGTNPTLIKIDFLCEKFPLGKRKRIKKKVSITEES